MLSASSLRKSYGQNVAVDGVSFTVNKGEIFGLLGPNGAGKSTTISMLVGLAKADAGTVTLQGEDVTPDAKTTKAKIGFVPQDLAIIEELSSMANLRFFGGLNNLSGQNLEVRARAVLEDVGLEGRASEPVKNFSGGMKRRLNIAVAMLHQPELMVLDEPTVGIDPQSRNAIFEVIERLRDQGVTILYTTHYMEEVERLCDRVAIMDHGKIIALEPINDLKMHIPHQSEISLEIAQPDRIATFHNLSLGHSIEGERLRIPSENIAQDMFTLMQFCKQEGIDIKSLETKEASLEEVFLHLTGRTLRD